jgi:hypothetical protein
MKTQENENKKTDKNELLALLDSHTIDIPKEEYALLEIMAKTNDLTVDQCVSTIINKNLNWEKQIQQEKDEMAVAVLEMVMATLNEKEDPSDLKSEIAADLLVAQIAVEYDKTGKFDKQKIKNLVTEIF